MTIEIISRTDVGKIRKNNEDNSFFAELSNLTDHFVALVSDGVGGKEFGEVASQTTVDVFQQLVDENKMDVAKDSSLRETMLEMAVRRAHLAIADKGKVEPRFSGMSCTIIVIMFDTNDVAFVNVGDSRLYHYANNHLCQVSEDQTVARALIKAGRLDEESLSTHPDRNVLNHALGVEAINHPLEPQTALFNWQTGDKLLLCTDGLTDMISDEIISATMAEFDGERLLDKLIEQALAAGGKDNVTIVLCEHNA